MGYNDDKEPDSRIAHIRKTSELAKAEPDPVACEKCNGFAEVAITDDDGKVTGSKPCDQCDATGVKL